ncbi:hypothetical protein [Lentzea cavernae]|uniref:Excreted virulence factor EspC, type VII ESX diderm n=1 Tax=Lentzea cavernae TaxID=2020703 RepID=A0ABQ3MGP8_9PSEU|nr:hypothetical protein [Lentzea cavernae]GHH41601.1 hypothetical protein GCM10017774_36480 [Lentzea cavernae]
MIATPRVRWSTGEVDAFYLESPASLGKLSDQLQRAGDDGAAGKRHVEKYADLTLPEEGVLLDTMASHEHAYDVVRGAMEAIAVRGRGVAKAVTQTADAYAREDAAGREAMDRVFRGLDPSSPRPDFSRYDAARRGPAFSDTAEPSDHFKQPERPSDDGPLFQYDPSSDVFSPAAGLRGVCIQVTGADPFEAMVRWLSGDWVAYHRCVTVWRQVGAACEQIGANIGRAGADTESVWRGNASDEARQYLAELARSVSDFAPICAKLAEHYEAGVQAAQKFNEALAAIAASLAEAASAWLIATMGLRITSRYQRAALIAIITYYTSQILQLVSEAMALWGKAKDRAAGVVGLVKGVEFGRLRDVRPPRMLLSPGSPL